MIFTFQFRPAKQINGTLKLASHVYVSVKCLTIGHAGETGLRSQEIQFDKSSF